MINFKINGKDQSAAKGTTVFDAVDAMQYVTMPSLYYLKNIVDSDTSGIAVVEIDGEVVPAMSTVVAEGMEILTDSPKVVEARTKALLDIANIHNHDCVTCTRTNNCELQDLFFKYKIKEDGFLERKGKTDLDETAPHIIRDTSKCIRCLRCVNVCNDIQAVGALETDGKEGLEAAVRASSEEGLGHTKCVTCGQCIAVCPVGAIYEKDNTQEVFDALEDPEKYVIAQVAPSVRSALGEAFEFPIGVDVEGRIAEALRELGFNKVFDTTLGADFTIMEEANEFIHRLRTGGKFPLITSCCPGWINYAELNFHGLLDNLSTCKSPHMMFGSIIKSYYAEKLEIDKKDVVVVSVMPCTAKKDEIHRDNQDEDVDYVLTTRELARMLKKKEIQLEAMDNTAKFDEPLGYGTGAGVIFGATGGVMEAALRTAVETLTGEVDKCIFSDVRGLAGTKEASYNAGGHMIKVAVVSGLANAKELLSKVEKGEVDYHFIEVMACPGGCVNGGGQPQIKAPIRNKINLSQARAEVLYNIDNNREIRKSHENPAIKAYYAEYLGKPGSEKAHQMLHTSYSKR
jgi:NADP-reducing hydrogenase subunit HndD